MKKTIITCDFCGEEVDKSLTCTIENRHYDICEKCLPASYVPEEKPVPFPLKVLRVDPVPTEIPQVPLPPNPPSTGLKLETDNLPNTCYVMKYLNAIKAGKRPTATHAKARAMQGVANALIVRDGTFEIRADVRVPALLDLIGYVNKNSGMLAATYERFCDEVDRKRICSANTAKNYRSMFNPGSLDIV